jgi:hypothetical protein
MKPRFALGLMAAMVWSCAVAAAAGDGTASIAFSTKKAHTASALTVGATFAPGADGQQRILTSITLVLPPGTRVDGKAVPVCPGDSDSVSQDPDGAKHACPAESQVGAGTAHVLLGDADTTFDATAWNMATGPMLELTVNGTPAYLVDSQVKGNKITFPLSLAEQINARTVSFELTFGKLGTAKKPYVRTPSSCPKGKWKGGLNADVSGGGKIALPASTACKKDKKH